MEPRRIYDYLTTARQPLFERIRPLGPAAYRQEFAVGPGSLAKVLTHMYISEWYYIERIEGRRVPPYAEWPVRDEHPPGFAELESLWNQQVQRTRATLDPQRDWSAAVEYQVTDDDGREILVTTTAADVVTQLILHEVHHRSQALNMLRQLGAQGEDLDFNLLMYQRREVDQ
ncbi:MAG: DinB family protein [Phycisphaerales bacterium]|nr:DinB family protein [Phycisphaerales bacterium]